MATDHTTLVVSGIEVEVVRKDIRNVHLAVYPPDGRVRIAVPLQVDDAAARLAVIEKLPWIRQQQREFAGQERQGPRRYVSGETHFFLGRRYRLQVAEVTAAPRVELRSKTRMLLEVRPGTDESGREETMERWYRERLREVAEPMIQTWSRRLGVQPRAWSVRHMRTKWGSCTTRSARILLNTELAKKSPEVIEYVVVHELAHLIEPGHGEAFTEVLDKHMPDWQRRRDLLNTAPLAHEDWQH